jgi:ribosomal protein S18 acetylase RimI-like enzyme
MHIRTFEYPEDFPSVVRLWKNAAPGIHLGFSDTQAEIARKLDYAPELFLVAFEGDRMIGTVLAGYDGRRGLIYHLTVDRECRRRGVGTALMDEIESRLRQLGCCKAYLLIMRENQEVVDFYGDRGWELMPVITMGKELR